MSKRLVRRSVFAKPEAKTRLGGSMSSLSMLWHSLNGLLSSPLSPQRAQRPRHSKDMLPQTATTRKHGTRFMVAGNMPLAHQKQRTDEHSNNRTANAEVQRWDSDSLLLHSIVRHSNVRRFAVSSHANPSGVASVSKRVQLGRKVSLMIPVGPFRCLAMMSSVTLVFM